MILCYIIVLYYTIWYYITLYYAIEKRDNTQRHGTICTSEQMAPTNAGPILIVLCLLSYFEWLYFAQPMGDGKQYRGTTWIHSWGSGHVSTNKLVCLKWQILDAQGMSEHDVRPDQIKSISPVAILDQGR